MVNKIKVLILWTILLIVLSNSQPLLPSFRIEIWQDTIYLGEPIMLKCWLVNNNNLPIKVWKEGPVGLLYTGNIVFYFISVSKDTSWYAVGIHDFIRRLPDLEILPGDSIYWYSLLGWHNFARSKTLKFQPGEFKIKGAYYLSVKSESFDSLLFSILESNVASYVAVQMPDSERIIYEEWIPLTREYFWWGERFRDRWVRQDYNELCKNVAETKSRFAQYAHYIYCKSTGDRKAMQEFLNKYPAGPLSELVEFMFNPDEARQRFPLNFSAK